MVTYSGESGLSDRIYNYKGDSISFNPDEYGNQSVGYITKPVYKQINGDYYRLVWRDEFDGKDLDRNFWVDRYFISNVSKKYQAWTDYYLKDSVLHLRSKKGAPDRYQGDQAGRTGKVAHSSIQSGELNNLGHFHTQPDYWHDVPPFYGLITQEGYYECRMKVYKATGGVHTAWWCTGVQRYWGQTGVSGEIDFTEILGNHTNQLPHGQHQNDDSSISESYRTTDVSVDFATDFHTIGVLWENGSIRWYVDGTIVDSMNIDTIQYPIYHLLSNYKTFEGTNWTGNADTSLGDVEFEIDYLRIYKKSTQQSSENVTISNYKPIDINANTDDMTIEPDTGCPLAFPLYVYVFWSDGSRTEHWVKWDAVKDTYRTKMTNRESFEWGGYVYGLGIEIVANVNY